jgi:urease alpha subunit
LLFRAIAHGISHLVGSIEPGKVADLVMYKPAFFGTKPELVMKGGMIAWGMMGDANASIPTPQPVISRPMFAAFPSATRHTSFAFVSKVSLESETDGPRSYSLRKRLEPVQKCRGIGKADMKMNNTLPKITVDAETYEVTVDGVKVEMGPAETLPMTQSAYMF